MKIIKDKGEYLKIFKTANRYCSEKKFKQGDDTLPMNYYRCLDILNNSTFVMMWWKTPKGYGLSFQEIVGDINERYVIDFEFSTDEMVYTLIKDYDLPVLQYFFNKEEVIEHLKYYQKWSRKKTHDEYLAPPDLVTLGLVIDEAIRLLILGSGSEDKAFNKT